MAVTAVEVLEKAHEIVLQGWTKRTSQRVAPFDPNVRLFCMTGALEQAAKLCGVPNEVKWDAEEALTDVVAGHMGSTGWGVISFNDRDQTRLRHVSDVFVDAIEILRAEDEEGSPKSWGGRMAEATGFICDVCKHFEFAVVKDGKTTMPKGWLTVIPQAKEGQEPDLSTKDQRKQVCGDMCLAVLGRLRWEAENPGKRFIIKVPEAQREEVA